MGKPRHNPDKPQNKYGGDFDCYNYDTHSNGDEFCHDEGQTGWGEWVRWWKTDNNDKLICKGNRHNCNKLRLKWLTSLSVQERDKYNK